MKNEQIDEIFNYIKDNILTEDYKGENTIIQTENVAFQISKFEDQKDSINPNISSIDLGKCESILKTQYNLSDKDSLIVVKTDIKNADLTTTYVQYEIYDPNTLEKLDLKYCNDVKITVNIPVNLNDDTISLYDSLSESGYNLFDCEDDFYNDICSTYTSENGTDMTLEDRKKEIYSISGNITMCQTGCIFESYNKTTKKAKCDCDAQNESTETNVTKINFEKDNFAQKFLSVLTNSNFLVLKCYKLILNFKNFAKNKGRIVMTVIYAIFLLLLLAYCIKDRKTVTNFIQSIIRNKISYCKNQKTKKKEEKLKNKSNNHNNKNVKKNKSLQKSNKKEKNSIKKDKKVKNKQKNNKEPPKKKNDIINNSNKRKKFDNKMLKGSPINTSKRTIINKMNSKKLININIIPIKNVTYEKVKKKIVKREKDKVEIYSKALNTDKDIKISEKKLINNTFENMKDLNDQELNTLEYEIAIQYDKRTYFQYYWSLLRKKQLILFTFLPSNDFNLITLKISLFLLSFSLYFNINGFFFSDDTMHKIHEDNGAFDILFQIPQILYSSIVSAIINIILKLLSLSEKDILLIKQEKNVQIAMKKSKNIEKYIFIKFVIFFMLSNVLLIFFWYFISCFCAVYNNTQIILIKDTLISFGLSMLYPFGLNLLPGFFRIPALRAKNQDKKILYKISGLVALI